MPEAEAVIDASPLILLARTSHLDLLLALQRPLAVPFPVLTLAELLRRAGE